MPLMTCVGSGSPGRRPPPLPPPLPPPVSPPRRDVFPARLRPPPPDPLLEDPDPPRRPPRRPPPPPLPEPDPPRREVLPERLRPPRRPPPPLAPLSLPPVRPLRDLPPLGEVSIRVIRVGTEDDEEGENEVGCDEVEVKERIGLAKEEEGEETNLVLEEEEMGNEENVFVFTGDEDDTMVGDRKPEDEDDAGKVEDCVNVVVREEGEMNELAGDRLAKIRAPQRGGADSPATARSATK